MREYSQILREYSQYPAFRSCATAMHSPSRAISTQQGQSWCQILSDRIFQKYCAQVIFQNIHICTNTFQYHFQKHKLILTECNMQGQRECQKQYWFHKEEDKIICKGKENDKTWSTRPTFAGSVPDLLLIPLWFNVRGSVDPIPRKWSQFRSQSAHFNCATFTKIHF